MSEHGKINSEALSAFENYRGVNQLCVRAGFVAHKLQAMQEAARKVGNYEMADALRDLHPLLTDSIEYLGIRYQPPAPHPHNGEKP